jgi:hypothetical protein
LDQRLPEIDNDGLAFSIRGLALKTSADTNE